MSAMSTTSVQRSLSAALAKPGLRALALVAVTAAATSVVMQLPATAQSPTPAPQMVVGLPDFTNLVDQVGPGVVNVEARIGGGMGQQAQAGPDDDMPELFRRFFGQELPPGFPQ